MSNAPLMRETKAAIADTGVGVHDIEFVKLTPEIDIAALEPFVAAGAELGAKCVITAPYDPDLSRLADRLVAMSDLCVAHGMRAVLEFFPWTEVPNLGAALAVVDAAGRAECGVLVDMLHFARSASTAEHCRGVPASRFPFVHICDAPAGTAWTREELFHAGRVERLPPGEGGIDIKAILANLPAGVPMSLEVPMTAMAAAQGEEAVALRVRQAADRPVRVRPPWSRPLSRPMTEPLTCDLPGDRLRRRRTVRRRHRSVPRPQGDRGGKGAGARRHHRLVGRLDVGAAEPGGAAGRHRRGAGSPARLPARRPGQQLRRSQGSRPSCMPRPAWSPSTSSTPL